jgi:hypothetical protein
MLWAWWGHSAVAVAAPTQGRSEAAATMPLEKACLRRSRVWLEAAAVVDLLPVWLEAAVVDLPLVRLEAPAVVDLLPVWLARPEAAAEAATPLGHGRLPLSLFLGNQRADSEALRQVLWPPMAEGAAADVGSQGHWQQPPLQQPLQLAVVVLLVLAAAAAPHAQLQWMEGAMVVAVDALLLAQQRWMEGKVVVDALLPAWLREATAPGMVPLA